MEKNDIIDLLEYKHQDLFVWLENQPDDKWIQGPIEKWTVGQQVLHLTNSLKLLNHAMSFPAFILKYKYGTANRALRDYDQVAKRYQENLIVNQERAKQFNNSLKKPSLLQKDALITTLKIQQKKLQHKTQKWKDHKLDNLVLPHPLMGRMPVRELLMWTAHHTEHHTNILKSNY